MIRFPGSMELLHHLFCFAKRGLTCALRAAPWRPASECAQLRPYGVVGTRRAFQVFHERKSHGIEKEKQ